MVLFMYLCMIYIHYYCVVSQRHFHTICLYKHLECVVIYLILAPFPSVHPLSDSFLRGDHLVAFALCVYVCVGTMLRDRLISL